MQALRTGAVFLALLLSVASGHVVASGHLRQGQQKAQMTPQQFDDSDGDASEIMDNSQEEAVTREDIVRGGDIPGVQEAPNANMPLMAKAPPPQMSLSAVAGQQQVQQQQAANSQQQLQQQQQLQELDQQQQQFQQQSAQLVTQQQQFEQAQRQQQMMQQQQMQQQKAQLEQSHQQRAQATQQQQAQLQQQAQMQQQAQLQQQAQMQQQAQLQAQYQAQQQAAQEAQMRARSLTSVSTQAREATRQMPPVGITRPKGWDQCLKFARSVKSQDVTGVELVRVWKSTCEPAVQSGHATERYRLMCNSMGGAVEPYAAQLDYDVENLCDSVLAVFHDVTAVDTKAR